MLERQLSEEVDFSFSITCLGATQLTEAAAREPLIFEKYYGAEMRGALRAISSDPSDEVEVRGLRLALVAAAGESSTEIRQELYSGGLIEVLSDGKERSYSACAKALSERLHIGYVISDAAIAPHLERLAVDGFVNKSGQALKITAAGQQRANDLRVQAAERFLDGRLAIRQALEESIGEKLAEDDFNRIWNILEDHITSHFHARGAAIVAEISALLEDSDADDRAEVQSGFSFLNELASAVAGTSAHPQRRAELHQAITDLFMNRSSGATEWLVRVCASFVACCALGLEHTSGAALSKLFGRTTLVLDSDVVLSLLGDGEPEHQSVLAIASKWIRVGGKVLVAEPVLEEVAYHAHIARNDFEQVRHLLPGTPEDRLYLIENVFVRAFAEHLAERTAAFGHWGRFIGQFVGTTPYDWKPVLAHLKAEYSVGLLPPRSAAYEELESKVKAFLVHTAEERGGTGKTVRDKASRDARLYAGMVHYLHTARSTDPGATCLLVSSAHRLIEAETNFHESGEQQIVVPISTVLYLLSLLPQVSLGLSAMKAFLFEDRRPGFSSDLERTILRLVRSSHEVSMPWAKRGVLMKEVRDRLIDDSRRAGRRIQEAGNTHSLERAALTAENKDRTIQLLSEALDKVAIRTRTEEENARLRKENESLKKKLESGAARIGKR